MFNSIQASERISQSIQNGPKSIVCFFEDKIPFSPCYFQWYENEAELKQGLIDILIFMFGLVSDTECDDVFFAKLSSLVNEEKSFDKNFLIKLENLLEELDLSNGSYDVQSFYIGTFDDLLSGDGAFQKGLRERFRDCSYEDSCRVDKNDKTRPIKTNEIDVFGEYLNSEFT